MRIIGVEAEAVRIPLARPIGSALAPYTHIDGMVIHLRTVDGPTGTGFTLSLGGNAGGALARYVADELAPAVIGGDASRPEAVWQAMWGPNKPRMRGGLGVWALSAVDMAVWDAFAKGAGVPLHSMLGGYATEVPVYGSGGWHTLTDVELVAECESFAEQGIGAYKFKLGTERDLERLILLRTEMGDDFRLFADANQKYTVREALEVAAMLADFGVAWLEEPVVADSVDDLAEVTAHSPVPTAAGENAALRWGFREMIERRAAAFVQPDVVRCGGITEFRRIAHLATAAGLALASHLWHEVHVSLLGATPAMYMAEYAPLLPEGTFTREFPVVEGRITVPDVPGHGVEFAPGALDRFAP